VPSEKCAVGWGSDNDEMRMITASFARAIEQFAGDLCLHFLPLFQQLVAIRQTCNQFNSIRAITLHVEEAWRVTQNIDDLGKLRGEALRKA
jgi:hypothetical protein